MAARDFPRFRNLPTELRLEIWSHCLPGPRVVEMDYPVSNKHLTLPAGSRRVLWSRPPAGQAHPLISRVCREARSVALGRLHQYVTNEAKPTNNNDDGTPCPTWESTWGVNAPVRFRKGSDIVHLNWHKGYERGGIVNDPGDPLPTFQWLVNQAAAGSVSAELLLPFDPERNDVYTIPTSFDYRDMGYFSPHRLYYAVLAIVEIHIPAEEAARAGVFGLLGEEPIQLDDPRDTATTAKFRNVWTRYYQTEARLPSDEQLSVGGFFYAAVDHTDAYCTRVERWRQNLDKVWLWWKGMDLKVSAATRAEFWPNWLSAMDDEFDPEDGNQVGVPYGWVYNWDARVLDREHPWVQEQLKLMPRFEPAVMFRHCVGSCEPVETNDE